MEQLEVVAVVVGAVPVVVVLLVRLVLLVLLVLLVVVPVLLALLVVVPVVVSPVVVTLVVVLVLPAHLLQPSPGAMLSTHQTASCPTLPMSTPWGRQPAPAHLSIPAWPSPMETCRDRSSLVPSALARSLW